MAATLDTLRSEAMHELVGQRFVRACSRAAERRAVAACWRVALVGIAISLSAFPTVASAGTLRTPSNELGMLAIVDYEAAPGERNDVVLSFDAEHSVVTLVDRGAPVTASGLCVSVDAHTARCSPFWVPVVRVELGDNDDELDAPDVAGLVANGGAGDDVLQGGNALWARLDGGGGRDHLVGTTGDDLLTDGDRNNASGGGGLGPDDIDGQAGTDYVSYRQRTARVFVDLNDKVLDGGRGENDTLRGIEGVIGGSGDDRLLGDAGYNVLNGGPGRDLVAGRGGDDVIGFVIGRPSPWGLAGEASISPLRDFENPPGRVPAFGDKVRCGHGRDVVWGRRASDFVERACEWITAQRRLPFGQHNGHIFDMGLPARPIQRRSSLTYPVVCSDEEDWEDPRWARLRCSGTVRLRESSRRRRLVAAATIRRGRGTLAARLKLTEVGRRLATRPHGVQVRLRIRGENLPTAAWLIRFTLR